MNCDFWWSNSTKSLSQQHLVFRSDGLCVCVGVGWLWQNCLQKIIQIGWVNFLPCSELVKIITIKRQINFPIVRHNIAQTDNCIRLVWVEGEKRRRRRTIRPKNRQSTNIEKWRLSLVLGEIVLEQWCMNFWSISTIFYCDPQMCINSDWNVTTWSDGVECIVNRISFF